MKERQKDRNKKKLKRRSKKNFIRERECTLYRALRGRTINQSPVFWMNHEEHVGETGAKIGAIGVVVARRFRSVNIHALGTVQFHHRLACQTN